MKLFLLSQDANTGYDVFDAVVVAAETEDEARNIHPWGNWGDNTVWCDDPNQVDVKHIGEAADHIVKGVVLGSFNAG